ncbi:hypothetical protein [Nonomuraea sp. LPB2021202275-12-8]|uniref:beta-xylosidase family glycoside hydrolase n=1 Tax=Nonomuraea sp. LPB2021202275-12-8 TaxID=3120159 RepID=UPI00300D9ECA
MVFTDAGVRGRVTLRAELDGPVLRFSYDAGGGLRAVPADLDATILSDEHADEVIGGLVRAFGFTGAFVGLWVQDIAGEGCRATFDHTTYQER